ncbi:MAG: hypothetical protein NUV45_13850 [Tepidanaerobacteraceae bacterium]|jgi:hypothetical protein|nr:hypothetical protein [Tepidanaerobacteraceae bacterium]
MGKIEKLMDFIWLLNSQVNSLCEPMMLTKNAVQQAREYEDIFKRGEIDREEAVIIRKELENSLIYIRETGKKLNELEDELFAMLENLTEAIKTEEG